MVQSNKILTVSYGTFSCTLEGFDDSFDTMKAIAEYFRDLAADDRYFGAEPPTPDAEMLARIAEKEIERRVEAHTDDQGILLRAAPAAGAAALAGVAALTTDDTADAEANADETVEAEPAELVVEDAPLDEAPTDVDVVASAEVETFDQTEADEPVIESDAEPADLVEAGEFVEASEEEAVEDAETPAEELHAPTEESASIAESAADEEASIGEELAEESTEATDILEAAVEEVATEAEEVAEAEVEPLEPSPQPAPSFDASSVAAKLARIRAVVSGNSASASEYTEDEHAETEADAFAEDDEDADIRAVLEEKAARDADEPVEAADEHDDIEAITPDVGDDAEAAAEEAVAENADAQEDAEAQPVVRAQPKVRVVRVKRQPGAGEAAAPLVLDAAARVEEEESSLSPEDEEDLMRELAAVEAEFADDQETAETVADETTDEAESLADEGAAEEGAAELEIEDEAMDDVADVAEDAGEDETAPAPEVDVAAFLARGHVDQDDKQDVKADVEETPAIPVLEDEEPSPADPMITRSIRALTRRVRMAESAAGEGEADVSRLMAETEAQLDEPEGRSRRSAIAHLRAAVAATREERQSSTRDAQSDDREAQFREDLNAVRPRATDGEAKRAAPLKLVAEQRVDPESDDAGDQPRPQLSDAEIRAASSRQTVRPRRIAARGPVSRDDAQENEDSDRGFMDYAEEIGARDLPELLEAAAAYMTLVEKRPQFSRPQLMNKVRQVNDEDYSREDRLRYFGQLLREGKIEKTASGRFTASEQIGFRPERAAG